MIFQIPEAQKSKELSLGVQSLRALIQNFGGCYKDYKIPRHYIKMLYGLQDTSTLYKAITRTTRYLDTITKTTRYLDIIQGAALNVTHFESRITHLLYTVINTTEHG